MRFGFREDRERLPVAVVVEPGLAGEQAASAVIAPGAQLGAGALDDEGRVLVRLARRGGQQRLRRVPRPAGRVQRLGALRRGTPFLRRRERRHGEQQEKEEGDPGPQCIRRTRASTRM